MNKQRGSIATVVIILIIVGATIAAYVYYQKNKTVEPIVNEVRESVTKNSPTLSQSEAEALAKRTWGDCPSDSCSNLVVTVDRNDFGQNKVTATYTNLDDSVAQSRFVAVANNVNGTWYLGQAIKTHSCHNGRGHADFSMAPCI